jgi:hypothetical protein
MHALHEQKVHTKRHEAQRELRAQSEEGEAKSQVL